MSKEKENQSSSTGNLNNLSTNTSTLSNREKSNNNIEEITQSEKMRYKNADEIYE